MTGSKKNIEKILWERFFDEEHGEFTLLSFSRKFLNNEIKEKEVNAIWSNDVYTIIRNWQKTCDDFYTEIKKEGEILFQVGVTDTRKICEKKYKDFIIACIVNRIIPLYFDRDNKEYRVAKILSIYEELKSDKIEKLKDHLLKNLEDMAKRGADLYSRGDTRKIYLECRDDLKKLERKKKECSICGKMIFIDNYKKHFKECQLKEKGSKKK